MSDQSPAPASAERESAVATELENAAAVAEGEGQPVPPAQPAADPSAETPVEEKPKPKTKQQKAREAIFAKRSDQVAAEIAETLPPGPEAAEPVKEPAPVQQPQAVQQPDPGTTPKPPPAQPQAQTVKVKTPEGEIELTPDQIADAWLARRDAARIVAGAQPAKPQPVSEPPVPEAPQAPAASEPDDGEILRRIQFGDGDEAAQALKDLKASIARDIKRDMGPSAGQDIEQRVVARTMQEIARQAELEKFGADFKDVLSDRDLTVAGAHRQFEMKAQNLLAIGFTESELQTPGLDINALYRNMAAQGLVEPEVKVYDKAAAALREKFITGKPPASSGQQAPSQPGTQSAVASLDARREAKRSLPRPPAPASAVAPIGQAAPQRRTPAQIVQDMQRTRRGNAA